MSLPREVTEMIDREGQIASIKIGIGATGVAAYGLTLNEWVAAITIIYLILQIGLLIPKYVQIVRGYFKGNRDEL